MTIDFEPLEWVDTDDPQVPATPADPYIDAATLNQREQLIAALVAQINALTADAGQTELDLAAKADLDGSGKVPQAQVPAIALTDHLGAVASQAEMLALTGQRGDWCTRTDRGTDWQLVAEPSSSLGSWREMTYPASPVASVAGRTGAVTLSKTDVGLAAVDDTSDVGKPVSAAQQAALTAHTGNAANPHSVTKTQLGLASVDNTADTAKPVSAAQQAALDGKAAVVHGHVSTAITDFTEAVQDAVAGLLGAGSNVTLSYDDTAGTLSVSATGAGGTGLDAEQVRDAIGVALVGVGNVAVTVNDAADTITISTTATVNSTDAALRDRSSHTGTQDAATTVTGLASVATSGAYNDLTGKPTIPAGYTDEAAQDAAAAMIAAGTHTGLSFAYDDTGGRLSATATAAAAGPAIRDSFVGKANGALTTTDSGQSWISTGQVIPQINAGKIGYPAGQTLPPAGATYAQVDAGAAVVKVGGTIRFDNSVDTGASVALGLFSTSGVITTGTPTASPAHLAVTPTYFKFSVFANVNTDFTDLTPAGFAAPAVYFPSPLGTDGATTYPVEILLDRAAAKAYVTVGDNPTVEYQDPRIASVVGRWPFWESFPNGTASNLGGFTTVYADTAVTGTELNAGRGASRTRNGAGAGTARPTSRLRPGAMWWDTATSKTTISTGDSWRDAVSGAVVGNILTPAQACATDTAAVLSGSGTKTRENALVSPWKNTTAYRVTSTVAGAAQCYINAFLPVVAGQTYTLLIDQAMALTTGRTATCQINWYDAASAAVGTNAVGSTVNLVTTAPVTIPAVTAVAPAGATKVYAVVNINATAVSDAFLLTRFGWFNGTVTNYLEP